MLFPPLYYQQSGAVEACWAHNPEDDGSKPSSAMHFVDFSDMCILVACVIFVVAYFKGEVLGQMPQ